MTEISGKKLVLFDFDGTLTRKDTLFEIIKSVHGKRSFYWGLFRLSPCLLLFKIKLISNRRAKESVLTYFFGGMPYDKFQRKCDQFVSDRLPSLLRKDAMSVFGQFKEAGAEIFIVSASAENWIAPWCRDEGVTCIATRLEVKEGKITGKIKGENCNGIEKVNRIQSTIDLSKYYEIYAYGDSKGDLHMLQLAHHAHYRTFR